MGGEECFSFFLNNKMKNAKSCDWNVGKHKSLRDFFFDFE